MKFRLEAVTDGSTSVWNDDCALETLDRLVARAEDAGHLVILVDLEDIERSAWFTGARPHQQTRLLALRTAATAASWQPGGHLVRTAAEATRALAIANTPLTIVVENKLRDGALVDVAIRVYGSDELQTLWTKQPSPPAVTVENAGGVGGIGPTIVDHVQAMNQKGLPARMMALADSDRTGPNGEASKAANTLIALGKQHDLTVLILHKRAAENYLPDVWWREARAMDPQNANWVRGVDALLLKTPVERDYQDMGEGLKQVPGSIIKGKPYHLQCFRDWVTKLNETNRHELQEDLDRRDTSRDLRTLVTHIDEER